MTELTSTQIQIVEDQGGGEEVVRTENQPFEFHPIILEAYHEVNEWLSEKEETKQYRTKKARDKVKKKLTDETFESAALQYYVLFPGHSTKVAHSLDLIIGYDTIIKYLKYNSRVVVLDVGAGAGAASVAFIDCLLKLSESRQIEHPISIHFVAIDPNKFAIAIYNQIITKLRDKIQDKQYNLKITLKLINNSDLSAVTHLKEELKRQKNIWEIPCLTHTFLFQANVVSPFSDRYSQTESSRQELLSLGIEPEALSETKNDFGKEEATAYRQILENSDIDNLHVVTVGTDGFEQRVTDLVSSINSEFKDNRHAVKKYQESVNMSVKYKIPKTCYWMEYKNTSVWDVSFCAEVSSISNISLADEDWQNIKSTKNLYAAWACARHHLVSQALIDEIEIRLFESKLDANIARLQQQLIAYAHDVVQTDDRLHFKFPKNAGKLRPLGLSRIEEEILSTAIIQKLGQKISGMATRSYAYKFSRTHSNHSTEYLYENWFDAYSRYIDDARSAAQKTQGCLVIQTDIKSFYTQIIRSSLIQLFKDNLTRSNRIEWLLKTLFTRDIDNHETGQGIVQGNIASGFFANLYLLDLDARFGQGNEWGLDFFRYVDDMILVLPKPADKMAVLSALKDQLRAIELELNLDKKKTQYFTASEFIKATEKDKGIDDLQNEFQNWISCLWILDENNRRLFRDSHNRSQEEWWYRISIYRSCLKSIGILIDHTSLSRKVYKYLFNNKLCKKDNVFQGDFEMISLPNEDDKNLIKSWQNKFNEVNTRWTNKKKEIGNILHDLLSQSKVELEKAIENNDIENEKKQTKVFRFCINKLLQVDFGSQAFIDISCDTLMNSPWLIRNPSNLLQSLADRGCVSAIDLLLKCYIDETDIMKEYMKSIILRSIRFLPTVSNEVWETVVLNSVSSSNITSLMATETWLKVVERQPDLEKEHHLSKIREALNHEPKPIVRLKKNYMLILGRTSKAINMQEEDNENFLIKDVEEIIHDQEVDSLFDYYEPEILIQEYYSGYHDDGFYYP